MKVARMARLASRVFSLTELCVLLFGLALPTNTQDIPPGAPVITGPDVIVNGDTVKLTCTVNGGNPPPTVRWLRNEKNVSTGTERVTVTGSTVINVFTFKATSKEHLAVFECQSDNKVLQNPLTRTKFVEVYTTPNPPILVGPTSLTPGTQNRWTCTSIGAYPVQKMSMRIESTAFTTQFSSASQFDKNAKSYTVTGILNWSPTVANNGQRLCCDVTHQETTNVPQTKCLTLSVKSPLAVNAPRTFYNPTAKTTVTLNCVVTSGTATTIRWYKNRQQVSMFPRMTGGSANNPPLTITNVQMSDAGTYECEATDGSSTVKTNQITLSPIAPLAVNALQTFYNPTVKSTVTLNCVVTSGTATAIKWYKNSQQVSVFPRMSGGKVNNPPLTITNVQMSDAGSYICEATDGTSTVTTNPITVSPIAPLAVNAPQTFYNPTEETTVTLNCVVTSGTATSIRWYKNSQQIQMVSRMSGGNLNIPPLTITNVQMSDAGTYECWASDATSTVKTNPITVSPIAKQITEEIIINQILKDYNRLVRPTPSPDVEHSMHPTRIVECEKKLVLQGWVCMYWSDQRLTWTRGQNSVSLPHDKIWVPDITQEGEKPMFYEAPVWAAPKVVVTKDGRVGYCPQGFFTADNCLEKAGEKFQCSMKFRSWSYNKELMDIHLPTNREHVDLSLLEVHDKCELVSKCAKRNELTYACCGTRVYPHIMYSVVWQRRRNFCVNLSEQPTCK